MNTRLLTDLITDLIESIKNNDDYMTKSRKFNELARYIGPVELNGLREAWGYFEAPSSMVYSYAFDDTFDYLLQKYKGIQISS
jgi:hypothetical protein